MAIFGSIATVRAQALPQEKFAATFAYLDELFRAGSDAAARINAVPPGETHRVDLAGGAFALEQAYFSKPRPDGFFESHRKYIDVQVLVAGQEWMEVVDRELATERQSYLAERDLITYDDVASASLLHFNRGTAAIYYPVDVHMPGLFGVGERTLVRKTVIKVPVAE